MESESVRRRANVISSHLSASPFQDLSPSATHLFPMSCSNGLNSVMRRCDNRTFFARQGSNSQGFYMRQASTDQAKGCNNALEAPAFSRPAAKVEGNQSAVQGFVNADPNLEAPMFARPNRKYSGLASKGFDWSPRMDVVESGLSYVVTLEIPGVSIDNIKVEVDDHTLIVNGTRKNWSCGAACSNKSYHTREISEGPYRIVWPLPTNANKDNVSAEIQDGLLRITIPKLSGLRWLRKAYM
ncbi:hypothetical protein ABFS82_13G040400 [Erythranthe guttata]|uniref:SHSP domain-containing protein n=1 Tax=Erythranthe guttata TaxID=4155 RepID=A0A022QUP8_ERYGU|nr:hypothetical protein MIMGU_mgv1a012780mg [Erythranthe guttata]